MLDKSIRKFLYAVGSGIQHEAKKVAPVVTRNLKNDIKVYPNLSQNAVEIGNSSIAPYAKFVHYGTKPYTIVPKKKKALKTPYGVYKKVRHPGIKANPYLENGLKNYVKYGGLDAAIRRAGFEEDVIKELKLDEFRKLHGANIFTKILSVFK